MLSHSGDLNHTLKLVITKARAWLAAFLNCSSGLALIVKAVNLMSSLWCASTEYSLPYTHIPFTDLGLRFQDTPPAPFTFQTK